MATPNVPQVDIMVNDAWVNAVGVGNGVRNAPITINYGRANWASRTETGRANFLLDNRDGRWSPDYASGAYAGFLKRNLPVRIGVAEDDVHVGYTGVSKDIVSTPDVLGTGGGAPTTPSFVSVTESAETTNATTHTVDMPATVAAGDRLLLVCTVAQESASASADLDDWTLVVTDNLHSWHRWFIYEIEVVDATQATALSGSSVDFTSPNAVRSSSQVIRVSGARTGGSGGAWSVSTVARTASGSPNTNPDPPSLTTAWGADVNRFIALFTAGGTGANVTANPSGWTAGADGNASSGYIVGSAHLASSNATENPGTFTLDDSEQWMAVTFAYRPLADTSSDGVLDISGDIDMRVELQLLEDPIDDNGTTRYTIATKGSSAGGGWRWRLFTAQTYRGIGFIWRDSSNVLHNYEVWFTTAVPWEVFFDRVGLRFTLDVNDGASDSLASFYWSADGIDGTWTLIGTDSGEGVVDLKTNDEPIYLGGSPTDPTTYPAMPAKLYAFELRNGINGTVVADPDFTAQTVGASSFADTAGRTWTIGTGGTLTNMDWRFHGELASLPVRWDVAGDDVTAPVEAAGLFRRLRQGNRNVTSPIKRAIINEAESVVQYWPLEETGTQVTRFGAAVGNSPHTIEGGYPTTASSSAFLSSEPLPDPNNTTYICNLDEYTGSGQAQIRWLQSIPAALTLTDSVLLRAYTTDVTWEVEYRDDSPATGQLRVRAKRNATTLYTSAWISFNLIGKNLRMTLNLQQVGSQITVTIKGQQADETTAGGNVFSTVVTGNVGEVTRLVWFPGKDWKDMAVGHISVQSQITADDELADPLNSYDGERAGDRIIRLCTEEGIRSRIEGDPADTEVMGPQRPGTLIDLLQECADTDLGILYESRTTTAVAYRTRESMIDQTVRIALDYSSGELGRSPELDRDDQLFSNDVTVENASGATARAVLDNETDLSVSAPPVGAGRYDVRYEVNGRDDRLQALADTRLALSTVNEPRVSSLLLALETTALQTDTALRRSILDATLGDLLTIDNNLTVALGTSQIRQIIQGYTEQIGQFRHHIDLLTSPSSPWETGGITDPAQPHRVTFRSQQTLATPGAPVHVLTALGYTSTDAITRPDLDDILDDWVASTGGTTHNVTSAATWTTAIGNAVPGDLVRVTSTFDPGGGVTARGNKYGISGSNMTAAPSGGEPGLPIILTCADGAWVDDNDTSSNTGLLEIENTSHVWAVGFNVRDGQFGILARNLDGSEGYPCYIAYCQADNMGDAGIAAQGWFQLITSSGGTPPAGTGNEHGYSQWVVIEENFVDGVGVRDAQFGEGIYIGKGSPGYVGYAKNVWIRGNRCTDWTSDGIDVKPGCQRIFVTDNELYIGHAVSGAAINLGYISAGIGARPSWWDLDPEFYCEGNRVYDMNVTNTDVGSVDLMGYLGVSGCRIANNVFWAWPTTGTNGAWRARMEIGANDTEAEAYFRTDPTWIVNNTLWNNDSFDPAGYGGTLTAWPTAVSNIFDLRNNIVDQASPADGEVDAAASDFIATVPAIGVAGDAEWSTYGNGSAFDLATDSALIGTGESISDLEFFIDGKDISQRDIDTTTPNPGAYQPHPANQ